MQQAFYYNAIAQSFSGDIRKISRVKRKFETWKRAYERLRHSRRSTVDAEKAWQRVEQHGIRLILYDKPEYPWLLREMPDPPLGLYYIGQAPASKTPYLAIVGTRRTTPEGKAIAHRFAATMASYGVTIVSGMAFGIDAAAHEGSLHRNGKTIAVLACGLDTIYPKENASLAKKILATGGSIVSEYPPGERVAPYRFIERNRIVSGLAAGTLIIEAPEKSGALATATFAANANRNVYVVPGSIEHPNFKGSHALIRQGATLVTKPEDIFYDYDISPSENSFAIAQAENLQEKQVLAALQEIGGSVDIDKIAIMTKLEARIVARTLSFLLLRGIVKESSAGYTIER